MVRRYARRISTYARDRGVPFYRLYPGEAVLLPKPQGWHGPLPGIFAETVDTVTAEAGVLEIARGHVIGADGHIVDDSGTLLWDVSHVFHYSPHTHPLLATTVQKDPEFLPGQVAAIGAATGGKNLYHFLLEVVPRVHLLEKAGYRLNQFSAILVNRPEYSFVMAVLPRLGIPRQKIRETCSGTHLVAERLVVPSLPRDYTRSAWVYQYVRRHLTPHISCATPPRRVHISRGRSQNRRVTPDEPYRALLRRHGFTTFYLEELSFDRQCAVVAAADVIVAEHGAGLTHIVFCRPGTLVLEVLSGAWPFPYYYALASQLALRYACFFGYPGAPWIRYRRWGIRADYSVDLEQFEAFLVSRGV